MSVKTIIHDQNFLKLKAISAKAQDKQDAIDLRDTLLSQRDKAAGLAANMIGSRKRIIAFYLGPLPIIMINPRLVSKKDQYLAEEGCLSLDGTRAAVRYKTITVEYENMDFEKSSQVFKDFTAEVIQHELDHCDGILI